MEIPGAGEIMDAISDGFNNLFNNLTGANGGKGIKKLADESLNQTISRTPDSALAARAYQKGYLVAQQADGTYKFVDNAIGGKPYILPDLNSAELFLNDSAAYQDRVQGGKEALYTQKKAASDTAYQNSINALTNTKSTAATGYGLTPTDLANLLGRVPNAEDYTMLSKINNAGTAGAIYNGDTQAQLSNMASGQDTAAGLGLNNNTQALYKAIAQGIAENQNKVTSTTADGYNQDFLNTLQKDPALWQAYQKAKAGSDRAMKSTGSTAADLLSVLSEGKFASLADAQKLYNDRLTSASEMKGVTTTALQNALNGYVEQQLGVGRANYLENQNAAQNLATNLDTVAQAVASEGAKVDRASANEQAANNVKSTDLASAKEAASAASIAANDAKISDALAGVDVDKTLNDAKTTYGLSDEDVTNIKAQFAVNNNALAASKTAQSGKFNKYNSYQDANGSQIDEPLLNTVLNSNYYSNLLNPETIAANLKKTTASRAAADLGLDLSTDNIAGTYIDAANQGNDIYDTQADVARKNLMKALAIGDTKALNTLSKSFGLNTANLGKQGATAANYLSAQLNNQKNNASSALSMLQNQLVQKSQRQADTLAAYNAALDKQSDWATRKDTGLADIVAGRNANTSVINNAYQSVGGTGMSAASTANDTISNAVNQNNQRVSNINSTLNSLNSKGAAANTSNNATLERAKYTATANKALSDLIAKYTKTS